jgi:uncharacterized protein
MEPMPLPEKISGGPFSVREQHLLLDVASDSIRTGWKSGAPLEVEPSRYPDGLRQIRSSFVTLNRYGRLRGCIGSLEAKSALVQDVAENAFRAAFRDPRFSPLTEGEWAGLDMSISVLSPLERIRFRSEEELLRLVRPGRDGLVLEDGKFRGTFLPVLWATLGDPREFIRELKRKAGLSPDHWSEGVRVWRYTAQTVDRESAGKPSARD